MNKEKPPVEKKNWIGYVASMLLAIWTACAVSVEIRVGETLKEALGNISGYGIEWAILAALFGVLYYRAFFRKKLSFSWAALIVAALFGLFMVFGESYYYLGSWVFVLANRYQFILAIFVLVGYTLLFYTGIRLLFDLMDGGKFSPRTEEPVGKGLRKHFERHPLLISAALIFICWLPIIIIFYPGSVPYDGLAELNMFFGQRPMTNHHPVFVTWIMGLFMRFGRLLGADNYGIFSYVMAQSVVCAFIFALSVKYLRNLKAPFWLQVISLFYFALFPIWPAYAQAEIKDTLFTGVFVLYSLQIIDALKNSDNYFEKPWKIIGFCAVSLLLCLMRNNGLYIIAPVGILLIFAVRGRQKLWAACSLVAAIALFLAYSNVLLPVLKVQSGSIKEALSIPFQQTARYIATHGDDVTDEEKAAIDAILPYDEIAKNYDSELADPIKDMYRSDVTTEELKEYLKVWFEMLLKHPATYVQATMNNYYGYFYPNGQIENRLIFQYYCQGEPQYTGYFSYAYAESFTDAREFVSDYSYFLWRIPGVGLLYSPAVYTWALIIMFVLLLRKKRIKALIGLVPALLTVLICCASPVNALVRYMLPVMATLPLLIGWTLYQLRLAKDEEQQLLLEMNGAGTMPISRGREIFRFVISGGVCFLVEYGTLILMKEGFGIHYLIASGIGFMLSVVLNYLMCVRWVFPNTQGKGNKAKMLFLVTSLIGLALNQLFMWAFVDGLGIYYLLAKVITTILIMVWNYITKRKVLQGKQF